MTDLESSNPAREPAQQPPAGQPSSAQPQPAQAPPGAQPPQPAQPAGQPPAAAPQPAQPPPAQPPPEQAPPEQAPPERAAPEQPAGGGAHAPGRHAATTAEDRFFDTDERLTVGEPEAEVRRARVSWLSVLGLVLGTVGVLAALTGDLYPVAVLAGAIGLLLSLVGFAATGRTHVASRPLAIVALLVCVAALVLAAMVYSGQFDWLNREDQAGWLRQWLDDRIPGLDRW